MSSPSPRSSRALPLALALLLLAGWLALLLLPGVQTDLLREAWLARHAPLGFLAVFVFPDRPHRSARVLLVALPAFLLGLACAAVAVAWPLRGFSTPGASDLALPASAVAVGVLLALASRRGLFTLLFLPLKLGVLVLLLALATAALVLAASESQPLVAEPRPAPEAKDRAAALLRPDPRDPAPGAVVTLSLTQADLDALVARLLAPRLLPTRIAIVAAGDDQLALRAARRLPFVPRWLNLELVAGASVERGRLELRALGLRVGRFRVPRAGTDPLAPVLAALLRAERPLRPYLAAVLDAHVASGRLELRYARAEGRASRAPSAERAAESR